MPNSNFKVLVVDDAEPSRYTIIRTLTSSGYQVIEAATGEEALRTALSEQPDLITLDIHLPDILGFEVCRRLKQNPITSHIPVLQVSASYVRSRDLVYGLEGGADSYLVHPFEPPVLLATVKALLRTRQINDQLRISEERFRVTLKNAPISIFSCDLDLRYTWAYNPPSPLQTKDIIGKTDDEILSTDDVARFKQLKRQALTSRTGCRHTIRLTIAGDARSFDTTIEPAFLPSGELEGLTVAAIDVTELVETEEAQRRAVEEAEQANLAKTRFLSNMSHEIRTPLGIIQGFSDLALDEEVTESELREFLKTIKRNAANLTELIGKILDVAKVEAGRVEVEQTDFSFLALLEEIIADFTRQAQEKNIQLNCKVTNPFPPLISSDPTRIRQILTNLMSNALKFTDEGEIELTAKAFPSPGNLHTSTNIELSVKDTGIGISPEQQSKLFQPFTQADSSITRKYGGTGIGLSLSRKLAECLGGRLQLTESVLGQGSTFTLGLNVGEPEVVGSYYSAGAATASAHDSQQLVSDHANLSHLDLLLVEDTKDNRQLYVKILEKAGARVTVAHDGSHGLQLARASQYQIILMDLQMPVLDGYQAAAQLRADGIKVPIIALTANATRQEQNEALNGNFDEYLVKPIDGATLIKVLSRFNGPRGSTSP